MGAMFGTRIGTMMTMVNMSRGPGTCGNIVVLSTQTNERIHVDRLNCFRCKSRREAECATH